MTTPTATTHPLALPFAPSLRRVWAIALAGMVVGIACLSFMPNPNPTLSTGWDKANHAFGFAALAVAGAMAAAGGTAWLRHGGMPLLLLAFGVFIEAVQFFVPGRSTEFADVVADAIGIAIGLAVVAAWRRLAGLAP
jgi:VanZ family protein